VLHDAIHGIRVVKNYGSEEREYKKYIKASKDWSNSVAAAERRWQLIMPPLRLLLAFGEFAVIYVGGTMVLGMDLTLGEMVQFTAYVWALYGPIEWLMRMPRLLAQAMVSASKVFELLNEKVDLVDSRKSRIIDIQGKVTFNSVYFGYKAYNPVLKNISCVINPGEMVGLVGHSGAGKSTFINLIMRLYDVTSGEVKIDGVDVRDITQTCLRSQVGVVLQENFLFNGSVLDNIRYARPSASFEEIVSSAKVANCHEFIAQLPDGYNTVVGERGYNLSGGERQRIAIARAILHNPKIIILDEATASLDTQTEKQIQEALGRLTQGRTTIAIAHRLSTLSHADRLIVFDKGKVAEIGTHNELMSKGGTYFGLVMAQRQTARIRKAEQETVSG
jgi:ATP-binding cassette subfamily B protein